MLKIAMLSGSLRASSTNSAAIRAAARFAAACARTQVEVQICSIGELPHYSEDVEEEGWPATVQELRSHIESADAILISTPEYNGGIPGVLKNALDWLSRPDGNGSLQNKWVATVSASPAAFGAVWAQENLRFVTTRSGAKLINDDLVALPNVFELIDPSGELTDPTALAKIESLVDAVISHSIDIAGRDLVCPA
ncbi:NAD(P)H-dependent oxidoreductase [Nonomuraea sp. NPDC026600]|uniref:NADPH-dependent FMN reductase n=1 Tax=Nonomuraea sp. NPDC026600 TaxID=3155363 RepID=UPI0033DBC150